VKGYERAYGTGGTNLSNLINCSDDESTSSYPAHTTELVNQRFHIFHFADEKTTQSFFLLLVCSRAQ